MRLLASFLLLVATLTAREGYRTSDPAWTKVLSAIGQWPAQKNPALIVASGSDVAGKLRADAEAGAIVVVQGNSSVAAAFGFTASKNNVQVRGVKDSLAPELIIAWQKPVEVSRFAVPEGAAIHVVERWSGAPLLASIRVGEGSVLWVATDLGESGYERYPYLPQVLRSLGLQAPYEGRNLWAFFDWSYRRRVDLDYMAARWRKAGIAALHVAAWHFYDRDAESDAYLKQLIEACHRQQIHVYAWLELPHVSERFWNEHPEWRERTAAGQDAHLDWRKLISLQQPEARAAIEKGVRGLLQDFAWDGVNLAELYFESLEGAANKARFTPWHPVVLQRFERESSKSAAADMAGFIEFRAKLAAEMQRDWVSFLKREVPQLDLVLTHVDDRFDTRMRELIGADAARVMPLMDEHAFTFLIEDPATVWHLGPERYPEIARRYQPLTPHQERLAIDINVVERYQDVYPTKQQTGTELFRLVHLASQAFRRVALYFENSLLPQDLDLLPVAAAPVKQFERDEKRVVLETAGPVWVRWNGGAKLNGKAWGVVSGDRVLVPAGKHVLEAGPLPAVAVLDTNVEVLEAVLDRDAVVLTYESKLAGSIRLGRGSCAEAQECVVPMAAGKHTIRLQAPATSR